MEPIKRTDVIQESGFIHQMKWDGIRGIVCLKDGDVRIFTRSGNECTASYPELMKLSQSIDGAQAVLDGELVVFVDGKPSFYHALKRNQTRKSANVNQLLSINPIRYIVFDLLFLNGGDIRSKPLWQRQEILKAHFHPSQVAAVTEDFEDGEALFCLMKQQDMEGIVSKRLCSKYIPGKKHDDWYKTKTVKKILCAVTGIQLKNGLPVSISLGVFREQGLVPVGNVSSGLSQKDFSILKNFEQIKPHTDPILTCWVRFSEWTSSATLRHPVLMGFSDLPPSAATGEDVSL